MSLSDLDDFIVAVIVISGGLFKSSMSLLISSIDNLLLLLISNISCNAFNTVVFPALFSPIITLRPSLNSMFVLFLKPLKFSIVRLDINTKSSFLWILP